MHKREIMGSKSAKQVVKGYFHFENYLYFHGFSMLIRNSLLNNRCVEYSKRFCWTCERVPMSLGKQVQKYRMTRFFVVGKSQSSGTLQLLWKIHQCIPKCPINSAFKTNPIFCWTALSSQTVRYLPHNQPLAMDLCNCTKIWLKPATPSDECFHRKVQTIPISLSAHHSPGSIVCNEGAP